MTLTVCFTQTLNLTTQTLNRTAQTLNITAQTLTLILTVTKPTTSRSLPGIKSTLWKERVMGSRRGVCQRKFLTTSAICQKFSPIELSIAPATLALIFRQRWPLLATASVAAGENIVTPLSACTDSPSSCDGHSKEMGSSVHGSTNSCVTPACAMLPPMCCTLFACCLHFYS